MPYIDFNSRKKVKIWDGTTGSFFRSGIATFGHISLEKGMVLPVHSHFHEQWAHLVEGELEFTITDQATFLKPGMSAFIQSGVFHCRETFYTIFVSIVYLFYIFVVRILK